MFFHTYVYTQKYMFEHFEIFQENTTFYNSDEEYDEKLKKMKVFEGK